MKRKRPERENESEVAQLWPEWNSLILIGRIALLHPVTFWDVMLLEKVFSI